LSLNQTKDILENTKAIAIVGLSNDPEKPSFRVAAFLKQHGYRIVPVNPFVDKVLGEKSYKSLLDIPKNIQKVIDVVDVFRKPKDVVLIVNQAIQLKASVGRPFVVWMQLGIVNEEAAEAARQAGLTVVMNRCLMVEHHRLM
jgi:uncharacterized protein